MRDPNRIPMYMERLGTLWAKAPDMRLGQFLSNILSSYYHTTDHDPFFPEDEEFMKELEELW